MVSIQGWLGSFDHQRRDAAAFREAHKARLSKDRINNRTQIEGKQSLKRGKGESSAF